MSNSLVGLQISDICLGRVTPALASPLRIGFDTLPRVDWLHAWDIAVFRWVNRDLAHPALDALMRFLSGNALFVPGLVLTALVLLWRGGPRGLVFVLMLGLAAALANEFVVEPLKDGIQRLRPYAALGDEVVLRVGRGNPKGSMPSAHALNVALMATFVAMLYRRALWVVLPLAVGVGFSRVYNGAHFPTDVLAGAGLGVVVGFGVLVGGDWIWRRWAPRGRLRGWVRRVPTLRNPPRSWHADHDASSGSGPAT
ncbi:MAG: phosphatase PAP2 family protein [Verrucomicrobiales bacterium]|nr:phosphatase PAP2 family protein [Verrucomicrobiales bacterium]